MRFCIETGGTNIRLGIFDRAAGDERPKDFVTFENHTFEQVEEKCLQYAENYPKIDEIGVSSFGPICIDRSKPEYGSILSAPNEAKKSWLNKSLAVEIGKKLNVPLDKIFVNTDVTGAALGELIYGNHQKKDGTLVYVTIGTGVGIGAVVDGKPIRGKLHPEGGHCMVVKDERESHYPHFEGKCIYHKNCIENFIGIYSVAERLKVDIHDLAKIPDDDQIWDIISNYIGQLCLSLTYIMSPHCIVIGGGIMNRPSVLAGAKKYFEKYNNNYVTIEDIGGYIQRASVDYNGIHGAAHL